MYAAIMSVLIGGFFTLWGLLWIALPYDRGRNRPWPWWKIVGYKIIGVLGLGVGLLIMSPRIPVLHAWLSAAGSRIPKSAPHLIGTILLTMFAAGCFYFAVFLPRLMKQEDSQSTPQREETAQVACVASHNYPTVSDAEDQPDEGGEESHERAESGEGEGEEFAGTLLQEGLSEAISGWVFRKLPPKVALKLVSATLFTMGIAALLDAFFNTSKIYKAYNATAADFSLVQDSVETAGYVLVALLLLAGTITTAIKREKVLFVTLLIFLAGYVITIIVGFKLHSFDGWLYLIK